MLKLVHCDEVEFDKELSEFDTHGGVLRSKDNPDHVVAPVLMWLKAIDLLLDKLVKSGLDLSKIVALSGSAQV